VWHINSAATGPNLAANQAQAGLTLAVHRHHGMHTRTAAHTFADLPQTAGAGSVVRKFISLVSWIASTCRPTTAAPRALAPPRNQPFDRHPRLCEGRLMGLARKRLNWTSNRRFPSATRRRHLLPACTIPSSSAASFFKAAIPKTNPAPSP
jgi:hypothetical protein